MDLQNKVAIVTGGARGIGAATSKLLAERGARVVVNALNKSSAAENLMAEIEAAGGSAIFIQSDVRDPEGVARLISETKNQFGRIDIMVNNAGMNFTMKPFISMTWDEFAQKLNDELKAAFEMTKAVIPIMIEQNYGRLVYVSSALSKAPGPNFIAHGTSKGGIDAFVRYIAQEFGPYGITANVIAPGVIETDATANLPEELKQHLASITPLRRIGVAEDVARAIAFFSSDDSRYITGSYTPVSGGSLMV